MAVSLIKNNEAVWTDKAISYYNRHRNAFNISVEDEDSIIQSRGDGEATNFYEIYNDSEKVGEILLTKVVNDDNPAEIEDLGWEINIAIYDEYQKNGYGTEALTQLLMLKNLNKLFACVTHTNPIKEKIECMLVEFGFQFDAHISGLWIKSLSGERN